jgi:signal transduction histidine kinase
MLEALRGPAERPLAGGAPYSIEHRIVRADGSVRWVHGQADVVRDADGAALRMIGTVQDITDRRLLEDQLRQLQKMEAIGRLAGGIAHDLNNALTAISGFAELALGALTPDHRARPDVEEIRRGAERAASVTRQLLAFSRKTLLQPRRFDAGETVASMARLLTRVIGPEIRVAANAPGTPLVIIGDPGQIEQAIVNLALNAKDAMPKGGALRLSAALEDVPATDARARPAVPPGSYVVIRVADTGCGMSAETQARAFEPFFTTKEAGKGTGLGLSMVYGTMTQCRGFVFVDSQIDRGTTVELYFPPAPAETNAAPDAAGAWNAGGTVLVVDDEPAVRALVTSTLSSDPVNVLLATSAEDAIAIAGQHRDIHLLLTDVVMPGKSGIELAQLLVSERPGLRVLLMTGYSPDPAALNELPERASVLQKPFSPGDLRKRIREALDR